MKGDNWMNIRADFKKGLNYTEIGKKYGIDPRTVKKYSHAEMKPEYPKGTKRETKIEKYKGMIDELLCEAPYSAIRILEIITEQGFYRWKQKYGGLMPSEVRHLKQLEEENRQLKKLVADLSLDKQMLQDVLSKKF